jgi:hypothetical protein
MKKQIRWAIALGLFLGLSGAGWAQKASWIRLERFEFLKDGYRYVHQERVWKQGVPTVMVILECKKKISGIQFAKAYYYDKDKQRLGVSDKVNSYFIYGGEKTTGFANPPDLPEDQRVELHFAPPPEVDLDKLARVLFAIGNSAVIKTQVSPKDNADNYDFEEKAKMIHSGDD